MPLVHSGTPPVPLSYTSPPHSLLSLIYTPFPTPLLLSSTLLDAIPLDAIPLDAIPLDATAFTLLSGSNTAYYVSQPNTTSRPTKLPVSLEAPLVIITDPTSPVSNRPLSAQHARLPCFTTRHRSSHTRLPPHRSSVRLRSISSSSPYPFSSPSSAPSTRHTRSYLRFTNSRTRIQTFLDVFQRILGRSGHRNVILQSQG